MNWQLFQGATSPSPLDRWDRIQPSCKPECSRISDRSWLDGWMDGWCWHQLVSLSVTLSPLYSPQAAVFSPASVQQSPPTSSPVYALMCFHFTLTALLIKTPSRDQTSARISLTPVPVMQLSAFSFRFAACVRTYLHTDIRAGGWTDRRGRHVFVIWIFGARCRVEKKVECEYKTPCLHGAKLLEGACGSTSHLHPDVSWEIGLHASWNGN